MNEGSEQAEPRASQSLVFRRAAIEAHVRGGREGRPLHIVDTWTRWAVRVSVIVLVFAVVFAGTARVGEYATGIAVVRHEGRIVVTTPVSGTIQAMSVSPGQRVRAGQVLAHLDDAAQRAELQRVQNNYEQRLLELLREPGDSARRDRLAALDSELQRARAELEARAVLAPEDGLVSDVRVRPGQLLSPGDSVCSIERDSPSTVVMGLFPGHYRPLLEDVERRGDVLFLELEGFPDSRHAVFVRSIADEVVGPQEAMRYLGRDHQGTLELSGPVVVVETLMASDTFRAEGTEYRVYDGMQGTLEAQVRAQTLLEVLFPALREL
ncbi:hypothetical protein PPSIR1_03898 [Plesiocystis pacifica SIR-1]|uniref:Multidrug resistance protein MdtA-like barrel-sandwich hybrid domain-containing protein n=1 Tax=Plesiocystis pacifica SIR-1 TaxID=391625 RepID=A6G4D8_9BACT|nr:biotin/lipoyl-binding protein [Plesiocystis pacifica]EDM79250.1 hypothetical protein PPSIR1_03898 [Plesiocystis pacifica SIR-1]